MPPLFYPVDPSGALVEPPITHGLLSGYGVLTTFIVDPVRPVFRLKAHYERLREDCAFFAIRFPWPSFTSFEAMVASFCRRQLSEPQVLRVTVTTDTAWDASPPHEPLIGLSLRPIPTPIDSVSLGVVQFNRLFPTHKHISQIADRYFLQQIKAHGFEDYLRVSEAGYLTEASVANLFWINSDGSIATPHPETAGCLPGIMRQEVLEACQSEGLTVREGCYSPKALREAQGVFLTNAVRGLIPVRQVDDQAFALSAVHALQAQIRRDLPFHNRPESPSCGLR